MVRKVRFELTTPRVQGEYATIASLPDNGTGGETWTYDLEVKNLLL